jgi:hypothetical protein
MNNCEQQQNAAESMLRYLEQNTNQCLEFKKKGRNFVNSVDAN